MPVVAGVLFLGCLLMWASRKKKRSHEELHKADGTKPADPWETTRN